MSDYVMELTINEGAVDLPYLRPGLMIETTVDGVVDFGYRTEVSKMIEGKAIWNKTLVMKFPTLEPVIPVIVSMCMFRKQVLQQGFEVVGTAHFSISELIPILNKGTIQRTLRLNMAKGVIVKGGSLTISLKLSLDVANTLVPTKIEESSTITPNKKSFFIGNRWSSTVALWSMQYTKVNTSTPYTCAMLLFIFATITWTANYIF